VGNLTGRVMHRQITSKLEDNKGVLILVVLAAVTAWLVKVCVKHPRTSVTAAGLGYVYLAAGWQALAEAAAALLVVLVVWWCRWRESFLGIVVPFARAWRLRWFRYAPRWPGLAGAHGLFVTEHKPAAMHYGYAPAPVVHASKLVKVTVTPSVDRLTVTIPRGLDQTAFERSALALAHATESLGCRIRPAKPGRVVVELLRRDLLRETIPALPIGETVNLARVPIGRREDGRVWEIALDRGHLLVAGSSDAGKDSVTHSALRAVAPGIAEGWIQPWGFDPKGGMELTFARGLFHRLYTSDAEAMADGLEEVAAAMQARADRLAGHSRKHIPTVAEPFLLVVICELAALTALCDRKTAARVEKALGLLLTMGRAPGCAVVASLQDPGKDVIRWRNLFTYRIALRLMEAIEVDMVLGEGARDRGAVADELDPSRPGVGFMRLDGRPDPIRVRAAYCTDQDITAVAAAYAYRSRIPAPLPGQRTAPVDLTKPAEGAI
jgi:S-DNA-T family DNA segregation ATPase FtsK/SpoIIIE